MSFLIPALYLLGMGGGVVVVFIIDGGSRLRWLWASLVIVALVLVSMLLTKVL